MKIKHRVRVGLIALAVILLALFAFLLVNGCAPANNGGHLTIIHVNDRHGRMGADPYIAQLAAEAPDNVLILDAGDALHGQITANLSKGASMIELMNDVGYSAMVTGNHEYTYGIERLLELSEMMDFPMLAANVKDADGKNLFESRAVFPMDGVKVGVFGLATPETVAATDPRLMVGVVFDDPAETAAKEVAALKAEGCDIIVALVHLGLDNLSEPKDRSDSLAKAVPGIDVIIDGHSHTALPDGLLVGDTLIAQTGDYGQNIGVVEIEISKGTISKTAKLIPIPADDEESSLAADEVIVSKIAELDQENEAVTGVVVGHTPVFLQGEKTESRIGGTNLADLITDSLIYVTGADMAFQSGGNIRASIEAGDITMGEVLTTLPYSNLIVTVELTGEDILKILEHGVGLYPEPVGQYIHVAGLRFIFDPNAESGGRMKTVTMSDGSALSPDKTYTVATIDYIAAGGDGYDVMLNGKNIRYYGGDAEAFIAYLATNPSISADPENRASAVTGDGVAEYAYNPVDYAEKSNWASMPDTFDKPVDVFFAYPTAWSRPEGAPTYAEINDPAMLARVEEIIEERVSAFAGSGNVFVPYYRQCDAFEALTMTISQKDKLLLDGPAKDFTAAFDYYIKNINDGRPFILAGHSQGSNVLLYLLSDYMRENPDVQKRMVAAYVIGYSVTESYLSENTHLKFAENRTDTGVIISYNTEGAGITAPNPVVEPGALVINPISWTRSAEHAGAELSLGSRIIDDTGKYTKILNYADAQVDSERGTLICASIDPDKQGTNALFGRGIYHGLDYQLYYYDLEQNAVDRINAFLK